MVYLVMFSLILVKCIQVTASVDGNEAFKISI